MSREDYDASVRKFLRTVGVSAQRAIDEAVEAALAADTLPLGPVEARAVIEVEALGVHHVVEVTLALPDTPA